MRARVPEPLVEAVGVDARGERDGEGEVGEHAPILPAEQHGGYAAAPDARATCASSRSTSIRRSSTDDQP